MVGVMYIYIYIEFGYLGCLRGLIGIKTKMLIGEENKTFGQVSRFAFERGMKCWTHKKKKRIRKKK
jgi:hypothetical protein